MEGEFLFSQIHRLDTSLIAVCVSSRNGDKPPRPHRGETVVFNNCGTASGKSPTTPSGAEQVQKYENRYGKARIQLCA